MFGDGGRRFSRWVQRLPPHARQLVTEGLAKTLDYARSQNMPVAIEPLHPMYAADRACINTMRQALDVCDELGGEGIGVAADIYHIWWDPELADQIKRAGKSRLLAYHICDWLVPTSDMLTDRGMMGGDGRDRYSRHPQNGRSGRIFRSQRSRNLLCQQLVETGRR